MNCLLGGLGLRFVIWVEAISGQGRGLRGAPKTHSPLKL